MKRTLLLTGLFVLLPMALRAQTATGAGTVTGGGSIMMVGGSSHSVTLTWTDSTSSGVTGYNIYRSQTSGSGYAKLTATPLSATATSYTDTAVTAGQVYYYVATAVAGSTESGYSNQATASVPTP